MVETRIIPYGRQEITGDDIDAVARVLKSDYLTQGPAVLEFEKSFARYVGAEYAVAVTNGTAALHLGAMALEARPGKKVITSPITFVASANCALYCGAEVVFADIDPETYCLDPRKVEELLIADPGGYCGIIPVSFAGHPANLEVFRNLADRFGLWVMEDACHAPGASFRDSKGRDQSCGNGNYSDLSVFSFHPVKHIACGEGGMITTNSRGLYERLLLLRTHGICREPSQLLKSDGPWYYEMQTLGFNYRISDILCALGSSQLQRVDASFLRRQQIAQRYNRELEGLPITLPAVPKEVRHAFHLYVIQCQERRELFEHMRTQGICCQVHYIPVHKQPYYEQRYGKQTLPIAEAYYNHCLSLPMFHSMTDSEQTKVIQVIRSFYGK